MSRIPVKDRRGYDPAWDNMSVDMHLGMAEAPADDLVRVVLAHCRDSNPRETYDVSNLLEMPEDTDLDGLMALLIWQFEGHSWSQIDARFGRFNARACSTLLDGRVFEDGWSQTVRAPKWGLYDVGHAVTTFEYDSEGVGSSTPPEKLEPVEPGTIVADNNRLHFFSHSDYDFQSTMVDADRVKKQVVEDCGFYVAASLWPTLTDAFEDISRADIAAAYAIHQVF